MAKCKALLEQAAKAGEGDVPATLDAVLEAERGEIAESRARRYATDPQPPDDPRETYVGLALSGGGIRSATVSLGLLQGMHDIGVLPSVDYVSTVSGGGFTGGWWTAWLSRTRPEPVPFPPRERLEPERAPDYSRGESAPDGSRFASVDPIHHLRLFANYLTPRKGLLTADTWRAAAVFSRNLLLTWLVLAPILCAMVLLGQLYYVVQPFDGQVVRAFVHTDNRDTADTRVTPEIENHKFNGVSSTILWPRAKTAARPLLALLLMMAVVTAVWMHFNNAGNWATHLAIGGILLLIAGAAVLAWHPGLVSAGSHAIWHPLQFWDSFWKFFWQFFWDLAVLAVTLVVVVFIVRDINRPDGNGLGVTRQTKAGRATMWHGRLLTTFALTTLMLGFAGFAHEALIGVVVNLKNFNLATWKEKLAVVTTAASVISTIYSIFVSAPAGGRDRREVARPSLVSRIVLALAPPLALVVLAAAAALAMHWVLICVLSLPGRARWLELGAWAGLLLATVLAWWENEQITGTKGQSSGKNAPVNGKRVPVPRGLFGLAALLLIAALLHGLAPYVALPGPLAKWFNWSGGPLSFVRTVGLLAGMAVTIALGAGLAILRHRSTRVRSLLGFVSGLLFFWMLSLWFLGDANPRTEPLCAALSILGGFAGWILALGWVADPNALSLHTFYKNRLVRAYLGASNADRNREAQEISEPNPRDDVRLKDIVASRTGGPYHLVNATLNLVGGRDLVTAQRWAANYVLAPLYCGSTRTGFRPTAQYMSGELTLGAAVAASGAAVSPNMGAATPSAALALLLGAFNIRLGLWVPTPGRPSWMLPQMWLWPYYLLRESLSQTNDVGTHCYLTDGGHFDNTGLYSLVERGCRYIILADNGADPEPCFADVGEAIRRCRIDFGAEIELDTTPFRPAEGDKPGTAHVAYGRIRYHREHLKRLGWTHLEDKDCVGYLVWIKPSVLPQDAADVRQYRLENRNFPQQTTADQWFGESQFESYRKLGELSARAAFADARGITPLTGRKPTIKAVGELFKSLHERPRAGDDGLGWLQQVAGRLLELRPGRTSISPVAAPFVPTSAR